MENSEDAGYSYSLEKGLRKRSSSEKEEDEYLNELKQKELAEKSAHSRRAALQGLKDRTTSGLKYDVSTEMGKYVEARVRGALKYIPETFEQTRLDYEAGKISKRTYDTAFRQHKIEAAETRGSSTEERKYREKIRKETDKIDRERERQNIAVSADKAYYLAKARSAGRQAGIIATQQQFAIQQQQKRQRRQWARPVYQQSPFRQPTAQELDPLGIYTLKPYNSMHPTNTQQAQKIDMSYMNSLLGFNPPSPQSQPKAQKSQPNKPKRRKFNIFTAQWEWV